MEDPQPTRTTVKQITAISKPSSVSPRVSIDVYQGPNTAAAWYADYESAVCQDKAKVISTSWLYCEQLQGSTQAHADDTLFQVAATQGQTVLAATGDYGSEACSQFNHSKLLAVDDPSSEPYVTGVGGHSRRLRHAALGDGVE